MEIQKNRESDVNSRLYEACMNRPVAQIPQCASPIFHNAPLCNRNVHMCTFLLQNGALWDICLMHCRSCEMGLLVYLVANHLNGQCSFLDAQRRMQFCAIRKLLSKLIAFLFDYLHGRQHLDLSG